MSIYDSPKDINQKLNYTKSTQGIVDPEGRASPTLKLVQLHALAFTNAQLSQSRLSKTQSGEKNSNQSEISLSPNLCFPNVEEAAVPGPNEWEKCQVRLRVLFCSGNW